MIEKLVIQIKVGSDTDFDWLLHVEEALSQTLTRNNLGTVERHQLASSRINIFIAPVAAWEIVLAQVSETLEKLGILAKVVIAAHHGETGQYEVVRPDTFKGTFVL